MAETHTNHHQPPFSLPPLSQMTQGMVGRDDIPKTSPNVDVRDSGNWSMPSKHSSTLSSNPGGGLHLQTILNPDDSPSHRFSVGSATTPSSSRYSGHQGTNGVQLPHLNQSYSRESGDGTFLDSRRSSIDSNRFSSNMASMQLNNNPTSPYEQSNASRTSLASNLQQQRGIQSSQSTTAPRLNGRARSPSGSMRGAPVRIAPPIMGPRRGGAPEPTASTPTKGFAWAFPDNPDEEMESPDSSRQGSVAGSSTHTIESNAYGAHMHTLQPKSVTSLQSIDAQGMSSGNYSRTPELRVSHKLAERKRRSEMKDLFDSLNASLPNSPGNKSSKWEILTKAIDYLCSIQSTMERSRRESDHLRDELDKARGAENDVRSYDIELTAMYQQLCRLDPKGAHVYGPKSHSLAQAEKRQQAQAANGQQPLYPSGSNGHAPPPAQSWSSGSMQGVEYNNAYDRR